jgi:hypothetical protein
MDGRSSLRQGRILIDMAAVILRFGE